VLAHRASFLFFTNDNDYAKHQFNTQQKAQYENDGYLIVPEFFNPEQVALLYELATQDVVCAQSVRPY
jgi:hypothetical protein